MRISPRAVVAVSLLAAGTLSAAAQQPATFETGRILASTVQRSAISKARPRSLTMIQGNALDSTDGAMIDVVVRLRDARFGRIVDTQLTDKSGLFMFKAIDPGTYIVELMSNDELVLAASQLLNINAGEALSAIVKLPFRTPALAGLLGNAAAPSATALTLEAAAGGIVALVPTAPVSPVQ